ncbi:MAG: 5'-methylthioinosine phosphorylase [Lysobacterales bacterium]|jgi:5'-methylthioinosine phosphorylase
MRSIGLIGGTGLDNWGFSDEAVQIETPFGGTSGSIGVFNFPTARLLFLPRHGTAHTVSPHKVNYRANLYALHQAGAELVIAVNAVGGISSQFPPGTLVVPSQVIDYTWGRAHSFSDHADFPLLHFDFTEPFSQNLREELLRAGNDSGLDVIDGACIAVTQGPRLETAAEIERLEKDGSDLVGMTTMPEAALAREIGLEYASICVVSNWAAGKSNEPISMTEIDETMGKTVESVRMLLLKVISAIE